MMHPSLNGYVYLFATTTRTWCCLSNEVRQKLTSLVYRRSVSIMTHQDAIPNIMPQPMWWHTGTNQYLI